MKQKFRINPDGIIYEMWTTWQGLVRFQLHNVYEIFCLHNFFVLQNHILITEIYAESVYDQEHYLNLLHIDIVYIVFY